MSVVGYFISGFVGLGLVIYVIAAFVGVDENPPSTPKKAERAVAAPVHGSSPETSRVQRWLWSLRHISPVLLACIWIAYGVMHLALPRSANLQMPDGLKGLREPLWNASGAFEIAMGLLVVNERWRRWALLAQLLMLVALVPFVVYALGKDAALQDVLRGVPAPLARVVLVLHNLLLFVWTLRIYRDELKRPRPANERKSGASAAIREWWAAISFPPVLIVALVMLAANVAGCWVIAVGPWRSGALYLWALGSLATGALVGFLFGVPRWVPAKDGLQGDGRALYHPNTNIEKLSDWLTKILIGVGLVELHELGPTLSGTAAILARGLSLHGDDVVAAGEAQAFATGLIAYFLVAGLIQGFLLTRMFLTRAWQNDKH